jgi:TPP-dependent pyruvate/acetoin dehydrogenase alpha subunit
MYDPDRYRDKAEIEEWKERDPLVTFTALAREQGAITDDDVQAIERDVAAEIDAAIAFAEAGTLEAVSDLTRFVTSTGEARR